MEQSGTVPLMITGAILVGTGIAVLRFAPHIQRAGLRMMGEPRNRLAVWSRDVAASRTSLGSIRATGAMCMVVGAALIVLLATH
jgi:hypothetical protein